MKKSVFASLLLSIFIVYTCSITSILAGSLTPPGSVTNTMYTLTDIYNLTTGATTTIGSGGIPATPSTRSGTMYTLTEIYNAIVTELNKLSSAVILSGESVFGITGTLDVSHTNNFSTGQTTCYNTVGSTTSCAGTGQDGELQKGLSLSYIDNGDGTINDINTGLVWQKGTTTTYTWTNALTYCKNNTPALPGSNWRLPNATELVSLVDFTISATGTAKTNLTYFPGTPTNTFFWSATTAPVNFSEDLAIIVSFNDGIISINPKTDLYYIRCVRD